MQGVPSAEVTRVLFAPRDLPPLRPDAATDQARYQAWVTAREARRVGASVAGDVVIELLVPVAGPSMRSLGSCLRAVRRQTSSNWKVTIGLSGGPASTRWRLQQALRPADRGRISILSSPRGLVGGVGVARLLAFSTAPFVAILQPHDLLAPDAVALLSHALSHADVAYGDQDEVGPDGRFSRPQLKPDWSPELLLATPYLGTPLVFARSLLDPGELQADGGWEHDLMLRVGERATGIEHVSEVLVHRRSAGTPRASDRRPIAGALERRGEQADVEPTQGLDTTWSIRRRPPATTKTSVVIPFRDGAPYLRMVVDSITKTAGDADLELVLVDNGSAEPETKTFVEQLSARSDVIVLSDPRPFNWAALNNTAAKSASGDVLLFLNNDIEARQEGWLQALVAQALRPDVAAVGARLLFPDGRVQHAGVVIGLGGAAGHVFWGLPGEDPGYLGLAMTAHECSAVTGACLATRRDVFTELGGFDEHLGVDLNDVDYCLRAIHRGYRVLYEPGAELVHFESPTRGTSGSVPNVRRFVDQWIDDLTRGDPYLNRNLTRVDSSCALRGDNEDGWWQEWRSTLNSM